MRRLAYIAIALTTTVIASAAHATAVDTSGCAAMVSLDSADITALQGAADCYGSAASIDDSQINGLINVKSQNEAKVADLQRQIAALQSTILSEVASISALTTASQAARDAQTARLARIEALRSVGILSPSLSGLPDIPSEFDPTTLLKPFGVPPSMGADPLGAFRFVCGAGPLRYDDPIVFPGQPGKSHLHQFSGNITVDANSTYESLRSKGDGTCGGTGQGKTLNRSAYWHPAMLDGKGNVVQPDDYGIYYKRIPEGTPNCDPKSPQFQGICIDLPNGLRMVVGSNFKGGWRQPHTPAQTPYVGAFRFNCLTANGNGIAGVSGQYFDIASVPKCPVGSQFAMVLQFPMCWNGTQLDSPDHGSHMDYMYQGRCDAKHPYLIPAFLFSMGWKVQPGDDTTLWSLASDDIDKTKPRGWSIHADWFGAWDPEAGHKRWYPKCINGHLSGTGGSFCDGTSFDSGSPFHLKPDGTLVKAWTNPNHLVPIPPLPTPMTGMAH